MKALFGRDEKYNTKETGNFETFSCIFKGIKLKLNGNIIVFSIFLVCVCVWMDG